MTTPTYLGTHANLLPGDLVIAPMAELSTGWWRLPNGLAWQRITTEECLRSLGPHRGRFAVAYRGVADVADSEITTTGEFAGGVWPISSTGSKPNA